MSKLIVPQWPLSEGTAACSSTRTDGMSLPSYDSLNLGTHCGDNPDHVEGNRKQLSATGNLPSKPVQLGQIHGKDMLKLTSKPYASKQIDAFYSNTPGTVCAVMTAGCLPVLFCNRAGVEVTAVYAGWHGLCAGVSKETVFCFADNPENIPAQLGSAIGPCTFEVGAEVREVFMTIDTKANTAFIQHGDKYLADICQFTRQRLTSIDVEQIFGGDRCTHTGSEASFSYRRDKTTGRMASFTQLI